MKNDSLGCFSFALKLIEKIFLILLVIGNKMWYPYGEITDMKKCWWCLQWAKK